MLRIAIVGCGKIADAHAAAISLIPDCEIVGACDNEPLMAKQLCERFRIKQYFQNLDDMLGTARPDVVHITTPPQSHFSLGMQCMKAGCHVYVEKPFTLSSQQASQLIQTATQKDIKLTVGTDEQFSHVAVRMRKLVHDGYLGDPPYHMDVYYCYDLGDERYAKSFLANKAHWLRNLPGQLLQNVISHGIAKIAEFLKADDIRVIAHGFTSAFLRRLGEVELIDEVRSVICDGNQTTAYFTFSTQIRPPLREFRVYGTRNGLIIDQDHHAIIRVPGISYKSYLDKFVPLNYYAREYRRNMFSNARLFLSNNLHMKEGLKRLIELFYESILNNSPLPIPYREILLTTQIMDSMFTQIYGGPKCIGSSENPSGSV